MTKEEIIQAISDDKVMPFIQPEQLAEIVDFVIKNYNTSLPSNLDEAADRYGHEHTILPDEYNDGDIPDYERWTANAFIAGAEWMAGQGETFNGFVSARGNKRSLIAIEGSYQNFKFGKEVIVQIRKKE